MATLFSNMRRNLEDLDYTKNEYVPVSPSPTSRDSEESSLSYNQTQVEENDPNCILTIIYGLFLDGNIIFKK
jgi:hypothetical protein